VTKELSEQEFKNTFGKKMTDVTETAEPVVDIWDYVEELVQVSLVDKYVFENNLVEKVYRNDSSTFDHILLPTRDANVFVTLVVDLTNETLLGHISLNLNEKY
jgi:hypothetical protein